MRPFKTADELLALRESAPRHLPTAHINSASTTTTVSTSTTADKNDKNSECSILAGLAKHFECPICTEYMLPPILQCSSGHTICSKCRSRVLLCPMCRERFRQGFPIRNLGLERVAERIRFPCRNTVAGCRQVMQYNEVTTHYDACEYHTIKCPLPGRDCSWEGFTTGLMAHLNLAHPTVTTLAGVEIVFLATDVYLRGCIDWIMVQECWGRFFILVLHKTEQTIGGTFFTIFIQMIGTRAETKEFRYALELVGAENRLIWESKPGSIQDGLDASNKNCYKFDLVMAQLITSNQNMSIGVTIKKTV